jgi:hypothetical protein
MPVAVPNVYQAGRHAFNAREHALHGRAPGLRQNGCTAPWRQAAIKPAAILTDALDESGQPHI